MRKKTFTTILLVLLTTMTAWAADITQNTAVVINSSNKSTYNNKSISGTVPSNSYTGQHGNFISQGAIVVDGIELNLTIDGFTADYSAFNTSATTRASGISLVNGATLHLTLIGTNTLIGGYGGAGIAVPDGCTLEITAASTGSLTATGGNEMGGGAGIGSIGNSNKTNQGSNRLFPQGCGTITINGGTITAQGGTWHQQYTPAGGAAGIGSSEDSGVSTSASYGSTAYVNNVTGSITINGGTIDATGGAGAAGIGGGTAGTLQTISIMGGQVTATRGSDNAAAIGTGYNGFTSGSGTLTCPLITIEHGTVQANGNIGFGNAFDASNNVGDSYAFIGEANVTCTGSMNEPKMPEVKNSKTINIPDGVSAFRVYDPAGKDAEYSTQETGTSALTLTAPTGYRLQVTGTVKATGTFKVYDGTSESTQLAIVSNNMSGTPVSTASSGQSLKLKYATSGMSFGNPTYRSDYELLVTVFRAGEKKTVSIQQTDGGTVASDKSSAEYGETVTLTVTPNTNKFVERVIYNDGSDHTVNRSDDGKYRFAMPLNDVTVRAQFENINNLNFGTITGLKDVYLYDGGNAIDISYGVEAVNGAVLSNGTDYDAVITNSSNAAVTSVTVIGTYTLTITGKGNYTGSLTKTFVVQEGLRGSGTSEAPYLIGSTDEWDIFVRKVNSGVTFAGQYIDLECNITVAQGISNEKYFQGTFNGNSHTITMNNVSGKGLFGTTGHHESTVWKKNTITIKNLTVAGSIIGSGNDNYNNYCAAVVGCFGGGRAPCALENIIVTADITAASTSSVGGLVGITTGYCTNSISNCVFAGSINGGTHAAGLIGSYRANSGNTVTITNCLEVGTYTNVANFHPMAAVEDNNVTVTNGYYVHPKSGSPNGNCTKGTQVFTITTDENCYAETADVSYGGTDYFAANTEVKLTAISTEDYTLGSCSVKDADDNDVSVSEYNGVYTFTMPASNVTVSATLAPAAFSQSGDTYTIHTATGWGYFCDLINEGETFSGKTVKLDANIEVSRMAGSGDNPFCGNFDGGSNTLTFTADAADNYCAPFVGVKGGTTADDATTISNLSVVTTITAKDYRHMAGLIALQWGHVNVSDCHATVNISSTVGTSNPHDLYPAALVSQASSSDGGTLTVTGCTASGTISTDGKYAAGLVGIVQGTASISDCVSSVTIDSSTSGDGTHGGIVAALSGATNIYGTVFNGRLLGEDTESVGGFIGWRNKGANIYNSLFIPTEVTVKKDNSATFARNDVDTHNCYYTYYLCDGEHYVPYYATDGITRRNGHMRHTVTPGADVTIEAVALSGTATQYTVSGITAYAGGGIKRTVASADTYYYGQGDALSLTLGNTAAGAPAGYRYDTYTASAGTLAADGTLTMPDADVTITVNTAAAPMSDGQTHSVSYIDADGNQQTAQAIALDGSETSLGSYGQEKWYFVGTSFSHTGRIECHGNVHIILCDGKTMNVDGGSSEALWCSPGNFYFYGQSGQTGTLNTTGRISANGTDANVGTITINGGIINATGDYGIDGYNLVAINGGIVTATGSEGDGIWSNGTITLGWRTSTDRITASSYNGSISVKSGQALVDEDGNILSGDLTASAINGKTLQPAAAAVAFAPEGYATYYNGKNDVTLPAGVKARIVTANDGAALTYATIADGDTDNKVVPAGTAIMLQTAASNEGQTKALTLKTKSNATISGTNLLHGSDVEGTTTGDGKHYKLSYNTSGTDLGWYWGADDGAPFATVAHKAWLVLPNGTNARSFGLPDFGETTSLIENGKLIMDNEAGVWYTLDGRKLSGKPAKGVYIVNGRKIVVK